MARRVVYGNSFSENGWPMVDQGSCEWVRIPGAEHVSLQIQQGWPLSILRAFVADWHAYIEPVRDADSACWTPTNAVASSNHLSGSACDVNWNSHPFRVHNAGFNGAQIATMREMLAFYEDTVWWGNDWQNPRDAMHVQLNGNTFNNPHTGDVITRKIRADGFSTFRRGTTPVPPAPVSRQDQYALAVLAEGRRRGITERGIQIAFATVFVESNWKNYANARVPESMALPHDDVGSDAYSVGLFQQQVRDTGNGWWWGDARTCMDPTLSAGLFFGRLVKLDYNNTGRSPGSYAQAVQQSAFPDRYDQRWNDAVALFNRLAGAAPVPLPPPPPPPIAGDDMALVPQEQWAALYSAVMNQRPSRSPLRHLGETNVGDTPDQVWDIDSSVHILVVALLARLGSPKDLALLREVALADPTRYPDRQEDKLLAQAILADITSSPEPAPPTVAYPVPPPVVYQPPLPAIPERNGSTPEHTTGELIGQVFDALDALRLADALPIEARAPLAALISVLQVKNGSQL